MTDKTQYAIQVKDLTKSYDGKVVVNHIDLEVERGQIYGYLGPNGSGKTTTLRMICGLLKPDAGDGTCLGYDIITQADQIKMKVGYMTQRFSLYKDLTMYENLVFMARAYGLKDYKKHIKKMADQYEISKSRLNQLAGNLSGGWQQRLALVAALLHEPQVLLLDEPTAGVDPEARREFWDQISYLTTQGITTLVTTHYMDEAERCNYLTYIAYGNILARGTMQSIIKESGLKTLVASGKNVNHLKQEIQAYDPKIQLALFGNDLHISDSSEAALDKIAKHFKKDFHWQHQEASLEDVFIYLVNKAQDNFNT